MIWFILAVISGIFAFIFICDDEEGVAAIFIFLSFISFIICGISLDEEYEGDHKGESYVCVEYGTRTVTRKRIVSLTDTYDTYEEAYCVRREWVKDGE